MMRTTARKWLATGAAVVVIASLSGSTQAQHFPTRPVTLIVPHAPGGSTDLTLRALAEATQKHLGQPIIIENRAGASGTLGPAQMAATAKPDGYTVTQMHVTVFRLSFMTNTTYDPAKDFTYIMGLTGFTFGVVVKSDAPWKTFGEFIADAKANPGKINYASPGTGTSLHITMEQIAKQQGIKWTHVPFRGGAQPNAALLGGHVHASADATGWGPLVNSGELRLLVTWGANRSKNWPTVPTLKEIGIDMVVNSPYGLAGPKGMDPKIVKILHDAFKKGMEEPSYTAALVKLDQELAYLNTDDYVKHVAQQIEEAKTLVDELGLKSD